MDSKIIKIILGVVALAGCAFGVYKYKQKKLLSKIKKTKLIDIEFVKKWITTQDLENYNKSYTAVLIRGKELQHSLLLKLFFDINRVVALCIYDKKNKCLVNKEYFLAGEISDEFGKEEFVEFPFE